MCMNCTWPSFFFPHNVQTFLINIIHTSLSLKSHTLLFISLKSHTLLDLNQPPKFFFLSKSFIINHQNSRSTSVTTR
ncbi:hypothetical protein HanRHA438_Chr04g0167671 [Helianthus annuus]|nr:hypothetical protein HanIR_Chr04g0170001 [Helianthus annuus]KAJ0926143.1 hypothetical protein HanRHA438_Chr04g0167671 [Helianthus annuus]